MLFNVSFERTCEDYLKVTANPVALQREPRALLSVTHANDRVFIHLLQWAGIRPEKAAALSLAANNAWHHPGGAVRCGEVDLSPSELSFLCLVPKLHASA